jgi:hypothetical protein
MTMRALSRSILALPLLLLLCLDASGKAGPKFEPEQSPPADRGVVYVYRDFNLIGGGASYLVQANGVPVARLPSKGYFVYLAKPGEVEFSARTEAKTSVTLDIEAGKTYFIKGTIGVGVFVGHPHLVVVPSDVGGAEITDCTLVPDGRIMMGEEPKQKGPFDDAIVEIALADVLQPPAAPATVALEVLDKRTAVNMERTSLGQRMGNIVMQPGEVELIRAVIGATLQQVAASLPPAPERATPVVCEIVQFDVTTPSTALYWDATTDVALTLRVGEAERSVKGHGVKRTYVNPSAKVIKPAAVQALKQVAAASEAALRELLQ